MTVGSVSHLISDSSGIMFYSAINQNGAFYGLARSTAQSGTSSTIQLDSLEIDDDDYFNGSIVSLYGGAGQGQSRRVTDYAGGTRTCTVEPDWVATPSSSTLYVILPGGHTAGFSSTSGSVDANVETIAADAITDASIKDDAITKIQSSIISDSTPFAGANVDATISSRATPAQVNTQVSDVLKNDTIDERPAGAPTATPTFEQAISYLYMMWRNEVTQTSTVLTMKNDAGTSICDAAVSDDEVTAIKGGMTAI